jgi:hypothetical protein
MTNLTILGPAAVLILWSLVVLLWLVITRFTGFDQAGIDISDAPSGSRYADVEKDMPAKANWVSHNYTHLMEQPTIFYAVVIILALAGDSSSASIALAWAYTGIRITHSLWQGLVNIVTVRVVLFTLSTFCLLALAVRAVTRILL